MGEILRISLKLNFTLSTLGCYGLNQVISIGLNVPADRNMFGTFMK